MDESEPITAERNHAFIRGQRQPNGRIEWLSDRQDIEFVLTEERIKVFDRRLKESERDIEQHP